MIHSVVSSEGDYEAGNKYDLPTEVADGFIHKGYATGKLSRTFSAEETATINAQTQKVGI
jgi:hypothetical protein